MEKQGEFDFSDGKDRETNQPKERSQAELEQLLDMGKMNPYQTLNKATFIERLEEMDFYLFLGRSRMQNGSWGKYSFV